MTRHDSLRVPCADDFLRPPTVVARFDPAPSLELRAGARLGAWEVIELVARGGMGAVYRARRADAAYAQHVAVKVLDRRLASARAHARFGRERQVLADLDHPNITRLLDGGTTAEGVPYLVMEYVDGAPITTYCTERNATVAERVQVMREVCAAVTAAHARLVVHRDLKPANILVTANGTVKLLDFGIAALLDEERGLTATRTDERAVTPAYGSPEQLRGEATTTATDVYSLGAVLYELLTGRRPHEATALARYEAERRVCERDPIAPSRVVAHAAPARRRVIRGDLDTIVLTALQRTPALRYASVERFDDDLRRHLDALPIHARRERGVARARKFVRRHRGRVMAAILVVASMLAALGSTTYALHRARSERQDAIAARDETLHVIGFYEELLASANAFRRGRHVTLGELLDAAEARLDASAAVHRPETVAGIRMALARSYVSVMEWKEATPHLRAALAQYDDAPRERWIEIDRAECLNLLGRALTHQGKPEAIVHQRAALAERQRLFGAVHPLVAESTGCLAFATWASGAAPRDVGAAEALYRAAIAQYDALGLGTSRDAARMTMSLAFMDEQIGRLDEAETLYRRALEVYAVSPVTTDLYEFATRTGLSRVLERQGRLLEAIEEMERYRAALPDEVDPGRRQRAAWRIAMLCDASGDLARAGAQYRAALVVECERMAGSTRCSAGHRRAAAELTHALRATCDEAESARRIRRALTLLEADPEAAAAPIAPTLDAAYRHVRRIEATDDA